MHTAIVTTKCPISPVASKKNIPLFFNVWLMRRSKDSLTGEPKYPPSTHKRLSGVSHKSSNAFPGCGLQRLCYSVRTIHVIVKNGSGWSFCTQFPVWIINSFSFTLFYRISDFTAKLFLLTDSSKPLTHTLSKECGRFK